MSINWNWARKIANLGAIVLTIFLLLYFTGGGRIWSPAGLNNSNLIGDGGIFYQSAGKLADGESPYVLNNGDVENPGALFCYPPTLAVMLTPFSYLSILGQNIAWYGMITLGFIISFYIIYKLAIIVDINPPKGWGFPIVVGVVALMYDPIQNNYIYAQSNSILLLSIVVFMILYLQKCLALAGIVLGFGITFKFFPLIFIPLLLFRKEWKVLIYSGISVFIILLVPLIMVDPVQLYGDFINVFAARAGDEYEHVDFILPLYDAIIWFIPDAAGRVTKLLATVLLTIGMIVIDVYCRRKACKNNIDSRQFTVWIFAIYSTTILLIHPIAEVHNVVYTLPAFMLLAMYSLKEKKVFPIVCWALIYGLYFPLLWVENTPITFFSLVFLDLYCAILAIKYSKNRALSITD